MSLIKRSVSLEGHATSVALEAEFWAALEANARRRRLSLAGLIGEIDSQRGERPLASALRVWALLHQGLPEG
ncbi:ribbon-helix-helix domain-containing protein [Aquidulcibacter sp.]|jgi:predicted DNA-binding ribbon-helix-helix protein|uniref:ribbon-helix-helix domain-containing protein n=1 Tax=Aquidulcibacter sp. TaxID=2052990 RepID=UPI0034FCC648